MIMDLTDKDFEIMMIKIFKQRDERLENYMRKKLNVFLVKQSSFWGGF